MQRGESESSSDREILDLQDELSHQAERDSEANQARTPRRRGRKPLPIRWSRIINVNDFNVDDTEAYDIDDDIWHMDDELPSNTKKLPR